MYIIRSASQYAIHKYFGIVLSCLFCSRHHDLRMWGSVRMDSDDPKRMFSSMRAL